MRSCGRGNSSCFDPADHFHLQRVMRAADVHIRVGLDGGPPASRALAQCPRRCPADHREQSMATLTAWKFDLPDEREAKLREAFGLEA